ncbi:MAG: COQ9 family protein [Pseudomonadota bacterium]
MTETPRSESDHIAETREKLLEAALMHVVFDGWSDKTFDMAVADSGVEPGLAKLACPRGALDLAIAFHRTKDAALADALANELPAGLGFTAKVTWAVRKRLELVEFDKEAVRRGATLFALPIYASDGARLIWETADTIWTGVGDTSTDLNWYTKRATLSGVYSATVLYWLGDESEGHEATWAFLDRRIEDVMRIEKAKAKFRGSGVGKAWEAGPAKILSKISKPGSADRPLPGSPA